MPIVFNSRCLAAGEERLRSRLRSLGLRAKNAPGVCAVRYVSTNKKQNGFREWELKFSGLSGTFPEDKRGQFDACLRTVCAAGGWRKCLKAICVFTRTNNPHRILIGRDVRWVGAMVDQSCATAQCKSQTLVHNGSAVAMNWRNRPHHKVKIDRRPIHNGRNVWREP